MNKLEVGIDQLLIVLEEGIENKSLRYKLQEICYNINQEYNGKRKGEFECRSLSMVEVGM